MKRYSETNKASKKFIISWDAYDLLCCDFIGDHPKTDSKMPRYPVITQRKDNLLLTIEYEK